ncbi:MAG: CDP-alcohol phosphatidyltransferase family protein [Candidatus Gracilibacteria bacterium]|jgi:CDP-diacylglycerol--glycerol-3-phosphate 3-phosphatidyltransferase
MKIRKIFEPINLLSISRVVWAGLTVAFLGSWLSFLFLGIGMFSDFLDGTLSRRFGLTSKEGAFIDGFVDKIFFVMIFVALFLRLDLPLYYVALVFLREIFIILAAIVLFILKVAKKTSFKARWSGKILTIFQFVFLLMLMFEKSEFYYSSAWIIFVLSVWSVIDYAWSHHQTFLKPRK